jgi:DNA invertase Pin-like site-specific DNA recombinase
MMEELDDLKPEVLIVSDFDRFSRGEGHTSIEAQKAITARGVRILGIIDGGRAGPEDTIEQDLTAKLRAEFAWYERVKTRQRLRGGFNDYLERQVAGKLEEGERPIGRQPYIFNEGDIGLIQALLKDHATKKHIYEKYFRRTKRFKKMHLKTFYLVCKRYGL